MRVSGFEALLWRTVKRAWLVLVVGVLGLLLGLGSRPERGDSLFGVLVIAVVVSLVAAPVVRMSPPARTALRTLPRHRPLLLLTTALLGFVSFLVLWWTISNAVSPGTLAPLTLALLAVCAAGATVWLGRRT